MSGISEIGILRQHMMKGAVPLAEVANEYGVSHKIAALPKAISSTISYRRKKFEIVINSNLSEIRQRFAFAHEIAHYLMHRDLIACNDSPKKHVDFLFTKEKGEAFPLRPEHELQANKLAIQILMPAETITKLYRQGMTVENLAQDFTVTEEMMKIRLRTLKLAA